MWSGFIKKYSASLKVLVQEVEHTDNDIVQSFFHTWYWD